MSPAIKKGTKNTPLPMYQKDGIIPMVGSSDCIGTDTWLPVGAGGFFSFQKTGNSYNASGQIDWLIAPR